jgi:hypothetical protein
MCYLSSTSGSSHPEPTPSLGLSVTEPRCRPGSHGLCGHVSSLVLHVKEASICDEDLREDYAEATELVEAGSVGLALVVWGNIRALVVLHGGNEALDAVASAASVVAAPSIVVDINVVGLLNADCSVGGSGLVARNSRRA